MGNRKVDIVTARAVHLAMRPDFEVEDAARALLAMSDVSAPVLNAALLLVDRALVERWSTVAAHASDALRRALELAETAPMRIAS